MDAWKQHPSEHHQPAQLVATAVVISNVYATQALTDKQKRDCSWWNLHTILWSNGATGNTAVASAREPTL